MYVRFFNLQEQPFNLTPDPRFLFLSPQHEEALTTLAHGIHERKGFIEITGEVGTGKTLLCRALLDRLDNTVSTALIFNSYLNEIELLQAIVNDFGLTCKETTRKAYIDTLNQYLLQEFAADRNAMVLIDEAQNLEPRVIEQLRMLSNLETERGKLVQVVLVGQPELRDRLSTPQMRQLDQRIALRFHIHSLTRTETQQYITHRLSVAGAPNAVTFTRRALSMIYRHCAGIPRRINLLCDRLLVAAYVRGTRRLTARLVRQSLQDLGSSWQGRASRPRRWHLALTGIALAGCGAVGVLGGLVLLPTMQQQLQTLLAAHVSALLHASLPQPPMSQPVNPLLASQPEAPPLASQPEDPPLASQPEDPPPGPDRTTATQETQETPSPLATSAAPPPPLQIPSTDLALARLLWQMKTQSEAHLSRSQAELPKHWQGVLSQTASTTGLVVVPFQGNLPQLARLSRPCLIEVASPPTAPQSTLWVLAKGATDRVLTYREPEGLASVPLQQLRHLWYGKFYLTLEQRKYQEPLLRLGMQGARVQALQDVLKDLGYLNGTLSGLFDTPTLQAVKGFQRDHFLDVDGYVGRQTLIMLLHFGGQNLGETT
ncbi:hypothetical protein NKDENANG_01360 [Candidatus Entotheonellaceae bacterium PAL068K]